MHLSSPALTTSRPSGLTCAVRTQLLCPASVHTNRCVGRLQSLTVLSSLAVASMRPSGLKWTHRTVPVCALSTVERPSLREA